MAKSPKSTRCVRLNIWNTSVIVATLVSGVSSVYHTTFCMSSATRGNVSYLEQVVKSYTRQHVDSMDGVALLVFDADNSTGGRFMRLDNRIVEACGESGTDEAGIPSCKVRQQGLDVTAALTQCAYVTSGWVVLVEDDCVVCDGGLDETISTLIRLDVRQIGMAKFSKFLRATAFPVAVVGDYVRSVRDPVRLQVHPYDITIIEQWAPGRRVYVHDRNLFHHVGYVSTEPKRNEAGYRAAYSGLRSDVCFEKF